MPTKPTIVTDPLTNRGTAFTLEERRRLGIVGRFPAAVETLDQQVARSYAQLRSFATDLDKYVFLDQLHNRNEVLYYRLLTDHLAELLPIVYDPTVGEAIRKWSRDYRRSRAVYLSVDRIEDVRPSFEELGLGPDDVDRAVQRARTAQRRWARAPMRERSRVLLALHDLVWRLRDPLLDLVQWESGKARAHAFEELADTAMTARYYARTGARHLAARRRGGAVPGLTGVVVHRRPLGVVGIISPWNYPLTLAASDAVAALMAGNAVVLKPDSDTPFTALAVRRLLTRAGADPEPLERTNLFLQGVEDTIIAAQNVVVAAESLGLGTTYLGSIIGDVRRVIKALHLPTRTYPILGLLVGHPAQDPQYKPRLPREIAVGTDSYPEPDDHLDALTAYDAEVEQYYDLRDTSQRVDSFSQQMARALGQGNASRAPVLEVLHEQLLCLS